MKVESEVRKMIIWTVLTRICTCPVASEETFGMWLEIYYHMVKAFNACYRFLF
jgi:hypothetical protein